MLKRPKTKYTKSGEINIAFQVVGEGPIDIVYIPGWVSNIDMMWTEARLATFLTKLSSFSRLILFDKRGTGLSDRIDKYSTLEERMDDIRSVMDAVGSERAALFGHSEGGSASLLFAATYPQRTIALVTFGVFAKRKYSRDYPWAPTDAERQLSYKMIEDKWADGDMQGLRSLVPSLADDTTFMDWFASYLRASASPGAALDLQRQNTKVDITDILDTIKVPTLLLHRTGDKDVHLDEAKYIAKRIPNLTKSKIKRLIENKDYRSLNQLLEDKPNLANEGIAIPYDLFCKTKAHPLYRICDGVFSDKIAENESVIPAKIFIAT